MNPTKEDRTIDLPSFGGTVEVHLDGSNSLRLSIDGQWLDAADIKTLRKALKNLSKELAQ